ncbi:metallophosphoesterase [Nitrosomonas marina]|uniref:Predicted phosphoesterase n=1 Tax=Nitrosomonas marina TaxID=917 RepID=A0A1H8HTQ3_9PROT|nr:metallophosphoesterase [Nitrosomonas marina]SEN59385.1 Predicted phosphoesterase [Nitrosomonas marina]
MKIISYSDLHLEFKSGWKMPENIDADLMILAGDIITFQDYFPLTEFLTGWEKPVLYIAGNHEYYTRTPKDREEDAFKKWLSTNHPNVTFLRDESISIDGIHFFGGTMWTDFDGGNEQAMRIAEYQVNDFKLIKNPDSSPFKPADTLPLHGRYVKELLKWLETDLTGPRVVISHHAPVMNPHTKFTGSPLTPAFTSLDMLEIIKKYQPALWIYGHTHECDDQMIGNTRIISNQLGYPSFFGGFDCAGFDEKGKLINI